MRKKTIQHTNRILSAALLLGIVLLTGCEQPEFERSTSGGGEKNVSSELATLIIRVQDMPEYNAPDGETRTTNSSEPLIAEWVKAKSFDATRVTVRSGEAVTDDESAGPRIAMMELREDTVSSTPRSRSTMVVGVYFRLIAFRKTAGGYVFQSVADYTSAGSGSPVQQSGAMRLPINQTYRFVAYSLNSTTTPMDMPKPGYTWGVTQISLPNTARSLLTYDSGDITTNGETLGLTVSFVEQMCRIKVTIRAEGFGGVAYPECHGVSIMNCGPADKWVVGADAVGKSPGASAKVDIGEGGSGVITTVPDGSLGRISVHIESIVGHGPQSKNVDLVSTGIVRLARGHSYTMSIQVRYSPPGIQVAPGDISLRTTWLTSLDREDIAQLRWAEGNLVRTSEPGVYAWGTRTARGDYFEWSNVRGGGASPQEVDPCSRVDPEIYGTGWRTPSGREAHMMVGHVDRKTTIIDGVAGVWALNVGKGVFLPYNLVTFGMPAIAGISGDDKYYNTVRYWTTTTILSAVSSDRLYESIGWDNVTGSTQLNGLLRDRTAPNGLRCVQGPVFREWRFDPL